MRKIGIELEVSDITTYNVANLVYKYLKYDFNTWKNNVAIIDKPILKYNKWHVISDPTIKNSDGSKCMMTYLDNNKIKQARGAESNLWKGAEIITPPSNKYNEILHDLNNIINIVISNGGSMKKKLDNALHIHVDASDLTFDQIKIMPRKIYNIQNSLIKFFTIDGTVVPLYTKDDILRLENSNSIEEFYKEYVTLDNQELEHKHNNAKCRRVINIAPWLTRTLENKTIEFRVFSATKNIEYIKESIYLCLDIMDYLIYDKKIKNLEERTCYIESLYSE